MPVRRGCDSLYRLGVAASAKVLLTGCQNIDAQTGPFDKDIVVGSPSRPIQLSPSRDAVDKNLTADQGELKTWLGHLPDTVVEDVVSLALLNLENQLLVDKDKKLILTLINIESIKMNDFFFGIHSLLKILRGFHISTISISKRLWCILWEYEEILNRSLLREAVCQVLPHLPLISTLNLSYLADDRMMSVIGRYLPSLLSLDISNSMVTDRGLRLLAGSTTCSPSPRLQPSPSVTRNLSSLLDNKPSSNENVTICVGLLTHDRENRVGCYRLEKLKLQACECITETGIIYILENYKHLKKLVYHQRRSVFEILLSWCTKMESRQLKQNTVKLEQLEHGFPYGVAPFSDQIDSLRGVCPFLTSLNLVTEDYVLPHLTGFSQLTSITLELEDCIGEGFITFLTARGEYLKEVSVSCSTDPDSPLDVVEGGQQGHLFNLVVLAVATLCSKVKKMSVSGCGLVSSGAVESLQLMNKLNSSHWIRSQAPTWFRSLEVMMLMSYEDTLPSMTIHSVLLNNILKHSRSLQVLSMEGNFGSFLTDEYMASILQQNTFPRLRILDISVNDQGGIQGLIPLSLSSAQALIDRCPELKELRMSDWNLSEADFAGLLDQVKNNNWNLTLTRKIRSV